MTSEISFYIFLNIEDNKHLKQIISKDFNMLLKLECKGIDSVIHNHIGESLMRK